MVKVNKIKTKSTQYPRIPISWKKKKKAREKRICSLTLVPDLDWMTSHMIFIDFSVSSQLFAPTKVVIAKQSNSYNRNKNIKAGINKNSLKQKQKLCENFVNMTYRYLECITPQ